MATEQSKFQYVSWRHGVKRGAILGAATGGIPLAVICLTALAAIAVRVWLRGLLLGRLSFDERSYAVNGCSGDCFLRRTRRCACRRDGSYASQEKFGLG